MITLDFILTVCHLALLAPLAVLGLHKTWMVLLWWRHRHHSPVAGEFSPGPLPRVTVQLPIFNERFVVARLLRAIAALDYPRERLEIQVLDDSTDDSSQRITEILAELPADLRVHHLRRQDRVGFKAGALAAGLEVASGELIAIFDADFVPTADFLRRTVPHLDDPEVGLVQARWGHTNREHSALTQVQALLLDGHFRIEQPARSTNACLFNFNGTAGLFRRQCIDDAGGWQHDTLTEDMDLSYRAQLAGWRFVYLPDLQCPAELPVDMDGFLTQQHRWAKGSIQTGRKLLGRVFRSRLPVLAKVESLFHLLGNLAFPLLLGLILVAMPLQLVRWLGDGTGLWRLTWLEELPLLLATLSVLLYYGLSQLSLGRLSPRTLARLPLVLSMGAGACINNTMAVLTALRRDPGEFRRTPKSTPSDPGQRSLAYQSPRGVLPLLEALLGCWALTTAVFAGLLGQWSTAVFHCLFGAGLLWVGLQSLRSRHRLITALPAAVLAACSGSGGSTNAPIRSNAEPEIVTSQARIGKEHSLTEIVYATRRGLSFDDLPSHSGTETGIRMHPDGVRVLFSRQRRSNDKNSREIYVSSIDRSSGERRLTANSVIDDGGCWSPDGTDIVFSSTSDGNRGSRDLWRMTDSGTSALRLSTGDFDDRDPDWHATGIAFSRRALDNPGPARLMVMTADGTGMVQLTDGGGSGDGDFEPAWASDGKSLLFIRRADEDHQVLMQLVLTSPAPVVLGDAGGVDRFPRWSPLGDRIFVARSRPLLGLAGLRLYASKPDGSEPQLIFPDARFAYLGFDAVPGLGAYQTPAPGNIDVDERSGKLTMRLGRVSRGTAEDAIKLDGRSLRVATASFNRREVAGILLTQHLGQSDATRIVSLRLRVTMAISRTGTDSMVRLALRNTLEQRFDTVLEFAPADDQLHSYEFSTSSLAHIDRNGKLQLEVIGDMAAGDPAELAVDGIEIELRVLPETR